MYNVCISFWCQKVSQIYTKAKNMKKKYIYIYILIICYYKILSRIPWALQKFLVGCLFHMQ